LFCFPPLINNLLFLFSFALFSLFKSLNFLILFHYIAFHYISFYIYFLYIYISSCSPTPKSIERFPIDVHSHYFTPNMALEGLRSSFQRTKNKYQSSRIKGTRGGQEQNCEEHLNQKSHCNLNKDFNPFSTKLRRIQIQFAT
jgi:hypothetical protein